MIPALLAALGGMGLLGANRYLGDKYNDARRAENSAKISGMLGQAGQYELPPDQAGPQIQGSGLLGQLKDPREQEFAKFYGGLLTTPGYEQVGARGLNSLQEAGYQNSASNRPYYTALPTSTGYLRFNNRTGESAPLFNETGGSALPIAADPTTQARVYAAREAATTQARINAEKRTEATNNVPNAQALLGDLESQISNQPKTAVGRGTEQLLGWVGLGNEEQQKAMAEAETTIAQLMPYANKLPGPASDADRIDFKASIGAFNKAGASRAQKLAAVAQAKKSFDRLVKRYGLPGQQAQEQLQNNRPPLSSFGGN